MCGSLFLNDFVCFPMNFNEVPLILKKGNGGNLST